MSTTNNLSSACYGAIFLILVATCVWLVLAADNNNEQASSTQTFLKHWRHIGEFTQARRAFASATNGKHIYVLGGVDKNGQYLTSVEYAAVQADGHLDNWKKTSHLNNGRFYLSAVIVGEYLYAIGGANGPLGEDNIPSAHVERARILPSGALGPWQNQIYLNSPRRGLQSVAYDKYIYALGGYNGVFMKTVERANLDAHGNITGWTDISESFRVDRYIHAAAIHKNRIYLIAGHVEKQNSMSYGDVESATILDNGQLSPWRIEKSRLNTPRFIASAVSTEHYLYLAGGHDGTNRLTSVEYAGIQEDGSLGRWIQTLPLNTARSATVMLANNNSLYVLGGAGGDQVLNSVETAKSMPNGHIVAVKTHTSISK